MAQTLQTAQDSEIKDLLNHENIPYYPMTVLFSNLRDIEVVALSANATSFSHNSSSFRSNYSTLLPLSYYNIDDPSSDPTYLWIRHVQKCVIPVLCFLGLVGNLTSVGIFRDVSLKKKSCCSYLITKCLTDTLFLLSLFLVWLDRLQVHWFHKHGVCQMIIFTTYVCGFISVWMVVMVTLENYIRISHPHQVTILCTPGKARVVLMLLGLTAIFCYNFPLWTTYSATKQNRTMCSLNPDYSYVNEGLTYFDTAVTLVLPAVLVVALVCGIFISLLDVFRRNKRMRKLGRQRHVHFFCLSPYGRVTTMLLAVSITFIALHTPSHAIRIRLLFAQFVERRPTLYLHEFRLQRWFELLYYSNFATNCVTYLTFGKAFRNLYRQTYCCCHCRRKNPDTQGRDSECAQYVLDAPLREDVFVGAITETDVASIDMIMLKSSDEV